MGEVRFLFSPPLSCCVDSAGMCAGEQQVLICIIRSFLPESCLKGKPKGSQQQNYFLASKVFLSKASLNPWSIKAEKTNQEKNGMKLFLPKYQARFMCLEAGINQNSAGIALHPAVQCGCRLESTEFLLLRAACSAPSNLTWSVRSCT